MVIIGIELYCDAYVVFGTRVLMLQAFATTVKGCVGGWA